jgi:hypothetical protein
MNLKDKMELNKTLIDLIHKKVLILLGAVAGTWYYGLDFIKNEYLVINVFGFFIFMIFLFLSFGLFLNYLKLSKLEKEIEEIKQNGTY